MKRETGGMLLALAALAAGCFDDSGLDEVNYCAGTQSPYASHYRWQLIAHSAVVSGMAPGKRVVVRGFDGQRNALEEFLGVDLIGPGDWFPRSYRVGARGHVDLDGASLGRYDWSAIAEGRIRAGVWKPGGFLAMAVCSVHISPEDAVTDGAGEVVATLTCAGNDGVEITQLSAHFEVWIDPAARRVAGVEMPAIVPPEAASDQQCGFDSAEAYTWAIGIDRHLDRKVDLSVYSAATERSDSDPWFDLLPAKGEFWPAEGGLEFDDIAGRRFEITLTASGAGAGPETGTQECVLQVQYSGEEILDRVNAGEIFELDVGAGSGSCAESVISGAIEVSFVPYLKPLTDDHWPTVAE